MKKKRRALSWMLAILVLISCLYGVIPVSAETKNGALGAEEACEGHILGTFSGLPACVNQSGELHICKQNFPDENFRKRFILEGQDGGIDGYFTEQECMEVTFMDIPSFDMISSEGIEFFQNLHSLSIYGPGISTLDLSHNTALKEVSIRSNDSIKELDFSGNPELTYLHIEGCANIEKLDLTKNTNLTELVYDFNTNYQGENFLQELNLSNNTALESLHCNGSGLKDIYLSSPVLTKLMCYNNRLTELNLSNVPALTYLMCNFNWLKKLDTSQNPELEFLSCGNNQLTDLDVRENTKLIELTFGNSPDVGGMSLLDVSSEPLYFNKLTNLDLNNNVVLEQLGCGDNQLAELDLSKNTSLRQVTCNDNQLKELDVSANTSLERLDCSNNQLEQLHLGNNTVLKEVRCTNNQLTELDVSKNTGLANLYCSDNNLSKLDLSNNYLRALYCANNQLTELDLTKTDLWGGIDFILLDCSGQNTSLELLQVKSDLYVVNLSDIVSPENFSKIESVSDGEFDPATGLVSFDKSIPSFTYQYDVGDAMDGRPYFSMWVTVNLTLIPHEHTFGEWQTRIAPTCTDAGEEYRVCSTCAEEEVRAIPALGHDYAKEWSIDKDATCTQPGSKSHHCTRCKDKTEITEIPAKGHDFGEWVVITRPTATEDGFKVRTCSECHMEETEVILRLSLAIDINGNGSVNMQDLRLLLQHLADEDALIAEGAGDLNYDGAVNMMDARLLQQHLAGYQLEF